MAVITALKFLERMEREETLRTQLYVSKPENIYKLREFARGKGFVVSTHDLALAIQEYQERFATGTIQPLKEYLDGYKVLPPGEEVELDSLDEVDPDLEEDLETREA